MIQGFQNYLIFAIILRVSIAVLSATYFQPDEFFQSLEPAHSLVFGYGHLTWEWRSQPPIRSITYPALFVPVYGLLKRLRLDDSRCLIWGPKVLQGLLASITDWSICRLAANVLGDRYVYPSYLLSITSIFHLQTLSRTLSNSVETSLTTLALSYWPLSTPSIVLLFIPLLFAAIACMIRPTNAILWTFLILELSWRARSRGFKALLSIWLQVIMVGCAALTALIVLDSQYFRTRTFTPWNFLVANLSPISSFYGRNPWHFYLTQGIPLLANFSLPFFVYGAWQIIKKGLPPSRRLVYLIVWTVMIYSLAAHKEWRFIHPLLPVIHVVASKPIMDIYFTQSRRSPKAAKILARYRQLWILLTVIAAPLLLFIQSRAQISVMHYLRSIPNDQLRSVGFLMPCHSTPWQSYLHRTHLSEGLLWAIGCEPPLGGQDLETYRDQSDVFYESPITYLRDRFPSTVDTTYPPSPFPSSKPGCIDNSEDQWNHTWPSHLVFFGALLHHDGVRTLLEDLNYREVWNGWNGWEQDSRRRGGIKVWSQIMD